MRAAVVLFSAGHTVDNRSHTWSQIIDLVYFLCQRIHLEGRKG